MCWELYEGVGRFLNVYENVRIFMKIYTNEERRMRMYNVHTMNRSEGKS